MSPLSFSVIRNWQWSDHHRCVYRIQIWTSLSLDDFTLINILQKSSIFILEQIWTFLLSSSSWCLRQTPLTWHLLHLEHSSLEWTPSSLIPFVVTKLIYSYTNYCVHNLGYHTYYDINSWEIRDRHRRPQACHEIDYVKHTRWILKDIRRRTYNLTRFDPNLTYVHVERTWKRFINKLDTKRFNFPYHHDIRVFIFPLNLRIDYKSIPFLHAPSPYSSHS